jgi:hypothetical protein
MDPGARVDLDGPGAVGVLKGIGDGLITKRLGGRDEGVESR